MPIINVHPLPNGYSLTVETKEYMYFTPKQLVGGFFVRVAVGETEYMSKEMVSALTTAAATWPTVGDALKANAELMAKANEAVKMKTAAEKALAKTDEKIEKLTQTVRKLREDKANLFLENEKLRMKVNRFEMMLVGDSMRKKPKTQSKYVTVADLNRNTKPKKIVKVKPNIEPSTDIKKPAAIQYTLAQYNALLMPLKDTGLSTRTLGVLVKFCGSENATVGDIVSEPRSHLIRIKGAGAACMKEIDDFLAIHQLSFGMDIQGIMYEQSKKSADEKD